MIDELLSKLYNFLCELYRKCTQSDEERAKETIDELLDNCKDLIGCLTLNKVSSLREWTFEEHEEIETTRDIVGVIADKAKQSLDNMRLYLNCDTQFRGKIYIKDYTPDLLRLYPNSHDFRRRSVYMFTEDGKRDSFSGGWGDNTLSDDLEYGYRGSSDTAKEILDLVNKTSYMLIQYQCDNSDNDKYGTKYVFYKVLPEAKEELAKIVQNWVAKEDKENAEAERKAKIKEEHTNKVLKDLMED